MVVTQVTVLKLSILKFLTKRIHIFHNSNLQENPRLVPPGVVIVFQNQGGGTNRGGTNRGGTKRDKKGDFRHSKKLASPSYEDRIFTQFRTQVCLVLGLLPMIHHSYTKKTQKIEDTTLLCCRLLPIVSADSLIYKVQ